MKIRTLFLTLVILTTTIAGVDAQKNIRIKKKEFYISDDGFRDAWKAVRKGNKYFRMRKKGAYREAVKYYEVADEYNSGDLRLSYKLGISYLMSDRNKKALEKLEDVYDIMPNITKDFTFWYARALHVNGRFEDAIDAYEEYLANLKGLGAKTKKEEIDKYIEECNNGVKLKEQKPLRVLIDNLGPGINSEYAEYSPLFLKYDSIVIFTSSRPETMKGKRNPLNYEFYEDIYFSSYKNGKWHQAKPFAKPVNSKHNDAAVAVSVNGKELMIYRGYKKGGNIYRTMYNSDRDKWTKPKPIFRKINKKKSKETTLSFTHDSTTVYFVSDRRGGEGGRDIWYMEKRGNGWGRPKNLGPIINTKYDEEAVFIMPNDSVLYFSSKGHNTIGGYDIFRSYLLPDGTWSEPENIGIPVNTPDDDLFFNLSANGRFAYYASKANEGYGDYDLYSVVFLGAEKKIFNNNEDDLIAYFKKPYSEAKLDGPIAIKTMRLTVVKGTVTDYNDGHPLLATVEIVDNETNEQLQTIQTNPETGSFTVMLPSGKNYGMSVNAENYMFHSENFNIPQASQYQEIYKDIKLLPFDPGSKVVLRNVFFDTGKADLRPESYPELNRLAQVFMQYPNLVVEISGHTDNRGSRRTNMRLSLRRAQAVVDYLVSQGVPRERLVAKGYGPDQPVATNKTAEGRQLNRRVEAKVLKK